MGEIEHSTAKQLNPNVYREGMYIQPIPICAFTQSLSQMESRDNRPTEIEVQDESRTTR